MPKRNVSHEREQASMIGQYAREFRVPFPQAAEDTVERFTRIEEACNQFLDSNPDTQVQREVAEKALQFLEGGDDAPHVWDIFPLEVATSLEMLKIMAGKIPERRRNVCFQDLRNLLNTSIALHEEKSTRRAVALRRLEAKQAVQVLFDLLPLSPLSKRTRRFQSVMSSLAASDNLNDTFVDFPEDLREGKLSCPDTMISRLRFGAGAAGMLAQGVAKQIGFSLVTRVGL